MLPAGRGRLYEAESEGAGGDFSQASSVFCASSTPVLAVAENSWAVPRSPSAAADSFRTLAPSLLLSLSALDRRTWIRCPGEAQSIKASSPLANPRRASTIKNQPRSEPRVAKALMRGIHV